MKVAKETRQFCTCYKRRLRGLNATQRDMAYDSLTGKSLRTAFRHSNKLTSKQIDQVGEKMIPAITKCVQ